MQISAEWGNTSLVAISLATTALVAYISQREANARSNALNQMRTDMSATLTELRGDIGKLRDEIGLARTQERIRNLNRRMLRTERDFHWTRNIFARMPALFPAQSDEWERILKGCDDYVNERWRGRDSEEENPIP